MEIRDYLAEKEDRLKKGSQRIRNFKVFDFNYIPEKPLMREEVKPVIDGLLRYRRSGIPNHLLVFGSRGSGKTLMVKYLRRLFGDRSDLDFAYANCRLHNTSYKILAHLLGVKPRGTGMDELWERFCDEQDAPLVFVLDEVDLLSDKDRKKDILYLTSRSEQNYMALLLSNNPRFLSDLDESIKSTLQPEIVHFRHYTAPEIEKILRQRARAGLKEWDKATLGQIAALTTRNTNSDVRVAIKTLYYSALEPEAEVEEHFKKARRDIFVDLLSDLNDKNLLILKAAATTKSGHAKKVYRRYRSLSKEHGEKPFSYVYFHSGLSYLQSVGLILLVSAKVGRTYTKEIQLLFNPGLLDELFRLRFGQGR